MPHTPTPWVGLAALLAMFLLPFLPAWLFEGPRTIKHWPRRHVCGECNAPWTDGHTCAPAAGQVVAAHRALEADQVVEPGPTAPPLRGELRRLRPKAELERRRGAGISR